MLRQFFVLVFAAVTLASCGGGVVNLATPADGTNYPAAMGGNQYQQPIYVTLADNDYTGVTIRAIGAEKVSGLQCAGGNETYMICTMYPGNGGGGGFGQMQVVKFEAVRGDFRDVRVVTFGGMQQQTYNPQQPR